MSKLTGRVAVITGAGGGLGSAMALEMAREGADIVLSDLDESMCADVASKIQGLGRRALALSIDASKRAQIEKLVERAASDLGRVDIMVNNAGVELVKPLLETTEEDWDRIFAVNLKGVLFGIQLAAEQMIRQGDGGRIINMASAAGRGGRPLVAAYGTSKAGVIHLTQSAAGSLGPHSITVNSMCPGIIDTRMGMAVRDQIRARADAGEVPLKLVQAAPAALHDVGQPEDVARVAVFLASDDASYVTGQSINVCGGRRMN